MSCLKEFFGHKKGAFTDAKADKVGRFELAHNGSLFLDELGNMPLQQQTKLLAAIQNRQITPLGGNQPIDINIRLICATNHDLQQQVDEGSVSTRPIVPSEHGGDLFTAPEAANTRYSPFV